MVTLNPFGMLEKKEQYLESLSKCFDDIDIEKVMDESRRALVVMDLENNFQQLDLLVDFILRLDNEFHFEMANQEPGEATQGLNKWNTRLMNAMGTIEKILIVIEETAKKLDCQLYRDPILTPAKILDTRRKVRMTLKALSD